MKQYAKSEKLLKGFIRERNAVVKEENHEHHAIYQF